MAKLIKTTGTKFVAQYYIQATSETDFGNQFATLLQGRTTPEQAIWIAWSCATGAGVHYSICVGKWYLAGNDRGVSEPLAIAGTRILISSITADDLCYITSGTYKGHTFRLFDDTDVTQASGLPIHRTLKFGNHLLKKD